MAALRFMVIHCGQPDEHSSHLWSTSGDSYDIPPMACPGIYTEDWDEMARRVSVLEQVPFHVKPRGAAMDGMDEISNEMAKACALFNDMATPVDEATKGYRDRLVKDGWSQTSAEAMAVEYYRSVMTAVRRNISG